MKLLNIKFKFPYCKKKHTIRIGKYLKFVIPLIIETIEKDFPLFPPEIFVDDKRVIAYNNSSIELEDGQIINL